MNKFFLLHLPLILNCCASPAPPTAQLANLPDLRINQKARIVSDVLAGVWLVEAQECVDQASIKNDKNLLYQCEDILTPAQRDIVNADHYMLDSRIDVCTLKPALDDIIKGASILNLNPPAVILQFQVMFSVCKDT